MRQIKHPRNRGEKILNSVKIGSLAFESMNPDSSDESKSDSLSSSSHSSPGKCKKER